MFIPPVPHHLAGRGIETENIALSAESVHPVTIDGGRRKWAAGGIALEVQTALIGMSPNLSAGISSQAIDNILVSVRVPLCAGVAHRVEPAADNSHR